MSQQILMVNDLSKAFGKNEILHHIDLSIEKGNVYGLIGQNGAGKTTFLRTVSGLMKATGGTIKWHRKKPFIGYMPQTCRFNSSLSVKEVVRFYTEIRSSNWNDSAIILEKMKLDEKKKVKNLSPGQQKKLQITIAIAGDPDFYILDEPTAGLDPYAAHEMKNIIKRLREEGKTVIISSHILQDMEDVCTHLAIMDGGELVDNEELKDAKIREIVQDKLHFEEDSYE